MSIVLIDNRSVSLTVTWPATEGASRYTLEFRTSDQDDFQQLSDKLTQTQARKRNLTPQTTYFFRVAAVVNETPGAWITHDEGFTTLSADVDEQSMAAPKVSNAGSNQALHISWTQQDDSKYELQMRENLGGAEWTTIAPSLSGTEVKKKNLTSKLGYQFRVRPTANDSAPFSPPSDGAVAKGLAQGIQRFFNSLDDGTLLRSGVKEPVPLADALGGKEFVMLYASAHWVSSCNCF